jgi:hypothetical protein
VTVVQSATGNLSGGFSECMGCSSGAYLRAGLGTPAQTAGICHLMVPDLLFNNCMQTSGTRQ